LEGIKYLLFRLPSHCAAILAMNPTPDSASPSQLSTNKVVGFDLFAVSTLILELDILSILTVCSPYFVVSQGMPLSIVPAPQNIQSQLPYTLLADTSMGTFPTQIPYDVTRAVIQDSYPPLQHASHYPHVPPRTAITSLDNDVRNFTLHPPSIPPY